MVGTSWARNSKLELIFKLKTRVFALEFFELQLYPFCGVILMRELIIRHFWAKEHPHMLACHLITSYPKVFWKFGRFENGCHKTGFVKDIICFTVDLGSKARIETRIKSAKSSKLGPFKNTRIVPTLAVSEADTLFSGLFFNYITEGPS